MLGSGVMGSRIACHFANIGIETLLLDISPKELNKKEKAKGLSLKSKEVRNRIVNDSLDFALKSNPSPIYKKSFAKRITTGNFEDNLKDIADCDWIIEAIIEDHGIKVQLFKKVEKYRKPGSLITTNTSGIPVNSLIKGRSEDFQKHFCGTHFFNPPRYLKLFEIIPSSKTDKSVIEFLTEYSALYLGKTPVLCKDTPAFIANRIGVYSIMSLFHLVKEMGLSVEETDKLTGPVIGRPKSATFRTCDVVGLDTLVHVATGLKQYCPDDEENNLFAIPEYVSKMIKNNMLGAKTNQGFYKKIKDDKGKSQILALDLNTMEFRQQKKVKFPTLEMTKPIDNLKDRFKVLLSGKDKAGEFYRTSFFGLFQYITNRIPEITEEVYKIDDAITTGFGWETGPFEIWDATGVDRTVKAMEKAGKKPAKWVYDMLGSGVKSFYKIEKGSKLYYDIRSKKYKPVPGTEDKIILNNIRSTKTIWKNSETTIIDLGDGIINLEFHSKMNIIGGEIVAGINKAIDIAEKEFAGLVISNDSQNFSAGANVGLIFMLAIEEDWDELDFYVRHFQDTMMRIKYSSIPVIAAPHGLTLGGGCEICLHTDKIIANAESYIGLVEFGVGVIPAGGGTKEFAVRLSGELKNGDIRTNALTNRFMTIGQAKVSTSAHEAFNLGYLRKGVDEVYMNKDLQLKYAKNAALLMAEKGYTKPVMRKDIKVLGKEGLGILSAALGTMLEANYITAHEKKIAEKLGWVMCGGDLSSPTEVTEKYLIDLEREAFVSLCMERKTLERMESLLNKGKILRN